MSSPDPPTRAELGALIDGTLGEEERLRLEGLLEDNPEWFGEVEDVVGFDDFRGEYLRAAPSEVAVQPELLVDLIGKLKAGDFSQGAPERVADCLDQPIGEDGSPGRIGDYEVEALIAQGGMGLVFKGRDPHLQRRVAIKVLSPSLAAHPAARELFLNEARAAAALDHPNVLPIYAVHPGRDVPYFVMPFIEGPTLASFVKDGGDLSPARVAEIGEKVGRALSAAHEIGLVHRDIKPANILLDQGASRVLVADFGIASAAGESRRLISGTPDFMAPEQERGEPATPAADLYGLGKVLDICANGKRPAWLEKLISRMTAQRVEDRPASAAEVVDELKRRRVRRKVLPIVIGASLVAIGAVAAVLMTPPATPPKEPFYVEDTGARYMDLAEAIDSAPAGGEVVIERDGRYPLTGIVLDKPLTITASEGVDVVLVHEEVDDPMITTSADLTLAGIDVFRDLPQRTATPFFRIEESTLSLRNCTMISGQLPGVFYGRSAMVELAGSAGIDAEDSMSTAGWTNVFNFVPGERGVGVGSATVRLKHCLFGVGFVGSSNGGASEIDWEVENCSIGSRCLWIANPNFPLPEVDIRASRSVLFMNSAALWMPGKPGRWASGAVTWKGRENVYSDNSGFLRVSLSRALGPRADEPEDVQQWGALSQVEETDAAVVPHAMVTYKLGDLDAIKRAGESWMREVIGPKLIDFPGRGADLERLPF